MINLKIGGRKRRMALMTTAQAAEILAVTPATIRSMIRIGVLPAVRIISEYRIDEEDLHRFIEENKTAALPQAEIHD
jgi:excisionase family DNA binding protein